MVNRIFDDYQGPSIKINGVCYKWAGETTEPFNSHPSEIEGTFDTCLECAIESSSSLSSESESSESINNFSSSSESIENTSSSESIACQEGDIQFVLSQANALQFSPPVFFGVIPEGTVCVDGVHEGTYTNYGGEDLIVFSDSGAYQSYTDGQTIEVCEGVCLPQAVYKYSNLQLNVSPNTYRYTPVIIESSSSSSG